MLETVVSRVLISFLGKYVEGLDQLSVSVGITSGNVKLNNLRVKLDALEELQLPIAVRAGEISELELNIPWANLKSAPTKLEIKGLFLRLIPTSFDENDKDYMERQLKAKIQSLNIMELLAEAETTESKNKKDEEDSWVGEMVAVVLANLQVHIRSVHVRYVDNTSSSPFAFGFTIHGVQLQTTDKDYKAAFLSGVHYQKAETVHKLAKLSHFGVYWEGKEKLTQLPAGRNLRNQIMEGLIYRGGPLPALDYIIQPFTNELKLRMNKKPSLNLPKFVAELCLDQLTIALQENQIEIAADFFARISNFTKIIKYSRFRPPILKPSRAPLPSPSSSSFDDEEDEEEERKRREKDEEERRKKKKEVARGRWMFALRSVCFDVSERKKSWSWEHIKQSRANCREYVDLYVKKKKGTATGLDEKRCLAFESIMDFEMLLFCRQLARNYLEKDRIYQKEAKKAKEKQAEGQSWSMWAKNLVTDKEKETQLEMTSDLWKELHARLGDEDKEQTEETGFSLFSSFVITNFRISLISSKPSSNKEQIGEIRCGSLKSSLEINSAKNFQRMKVTAGRIDIRDASGGGGGQEERSLFPVILRTYNQVSSNPMKQETSLDMQLTRIMKEETERYEIRGELHPSTVVISLPFFEKVRDFFLPESQRSVLKDLEKEAYARLQNLAEETQKNLNLKMAASNIELSVHVTLHGPRVIVPHNIYNKNAPVLCWDVGTCVVGSVEEVNGEKEKEEEGEYNSRLYRRFDVSLRNAKAFIISSQNQLQTHKEVRKKIEANGQEKIFEIERKGIFTLPSSVQPFFVPSELQLRLNICSKDYPHLPNVGVTGELPSISLQLSPKQLGFCLAILDNFSGAQENDPHNGPQRGQLMLEGEEGKGERIGEGIEAVELFQERGRFESYLRGERRKKSRWRKEGEGSEMMEVLLKKIEFSIPKIELALLVDEEANEIFDGVLGGGWGEGEGRGGRKLCVLRVEQVELKAEMRGKHNDLEMNVGQALIEDCSSFPPRPLFLSSKPTQKDNHSLVKMKHRMTSKLSHNYKNIDQEIFVDISDCQFSFRRPIVVLLQVSVNIFLDTYQIWTKKKNEVESSVSPSPLATFSPPPSNHHLFVGLVLRVKEISLSLELEEEGGDKGKEKEGENCDGGRGELGKLVMESLVFGFVQGTDGNQFMCGSVGGLRLFDSLPGAWPSIIQEDLRGDKDLASFDITHQQHFPTQTLPTPYKYWMVKLTLQRIQLVALVPFLSLFSSYFLEYAELLDKCSKKAEEVSGKRNVLGVEGKKEEKDGEGSAGEGTVMMFRVEIQDTTLIIPHSCHENEGFVFGSVGSLLITNYDHQHSQPLITPLPYFSSLPSLPSLQIEQIRISATHIQLEKSGEVKILQESEKQQISTKENGQLYSFKMAPQENNLSVTFAMDSGMAIMTILDPLATVKTITKNLSNVTGIPPRSLSISPLSPSASLSPLPLSARFSDFNLSQNNIFFVYSGEKKDSIDICENDHFLGYSHRFLLSRADRERFSGNFLLENLLQETNLLISLDRVGTSPFSSPSPDPSAPSSTLPPLLSVSFICSSLSLSLSQESLDMVYELLKSNICGKNATQTIKIVSNIEKISQKAIQSQEKEGGWETHFPAKLSFVGKIGEVVTYCRLLGEEKAFFSVNLGGLMASWRGGAEGEGEGEFVMKSVEVGEIDSFSSSASFSCLSSSEEFASSPLSGSPPPSSSSLKLFSSIGGSEHPQLLMTMKTSLQSGTDIDITISSSQILISTEFGRVIGYLMDLMDDVDDTLSTISSSSPPPPSSSSSSSSTPARDNEKVTSTNVYFKNCEFCVRGESDGFVLQAPKLELHIVMADRPLFFQLSAEEFSLLRSNWSKKEENIMLLQPVDFNLMMNATSPSLTQIKLEIPIQDCYFYISFRDINFATVVATQISHLIEEVTTRKSQSYCVRTGIRAPKRKQPAPKDSQLVADIQPFSFHFILVDDNTGADLPLLQSKLCFQQGECTSSEQTSSPYSSSSSCERSTDVVTIEIDLQVDFYNLRRGVWEPLVESCQAEVLLSRTQYDNQYIQNQIEKMQRYSIQVITQDTLLINMTSDMIRSLLSAIETAQEILKEDQLAKRALDGEDEPKKSMHYFYTDEKKGRALRASHILQNRTGYPLAYKLEDETTIDVNIDEISPLPLSRKANRQLKKGLEGVKRVIELDVSSLWREGHEEESLQPPVSSSRLSCSSSFHSTLFLEKDEQSFLIPIDQTISLCRMRHSSDFPIICSVFFRQGYQVIDIRSNIILRNDTNRNLSVCCSLSNDKWLRILAPEDEISIPLNYIERGVIQYNPDETKYSWSPPAMMISWSANMKDQTGQLRCLPTEEEQKRNSLCSFNMKQVILHKYPDPYSLTVRLCPLLSLENLLPETLIYKITRSDRNEIIQMGEIHTGKEAQLFSPLSKDLFSLSFKLHGFQWSNPITNDEEKRKVKVVDVNERPLLLCLRNAAKRGNRRKISIYTPFWLVNKTGLPLTFKQINLYEKTSSLLARQIQPERARALTGPSTSWYPEMVDPQPQGILFTFIGRGENEKHRLAFQIGKSKIWSPPILLSNTAFTTALEIDYNTENDQTTRVFEIVAHSSPVKPPFWRSQTVTFRPRYILVNKLSSPIMFQQTGATPDFLDAGSSIPFHWKEKNKEKIFCFKVMKDAKTPLTELSGFLDLKILKRLPLLLTRKGEGKSFPNINGGVFCPPDSIFVTLKPTVVEGTTYITLINMEEKTVPQVVIENHLPFSLRFSQSTTPAKGYNMKGTQKGFTLSEGGKVYWSFPQPFVCENKIRFLVGREEFEIYPSSTSPTLNLQINNPYSVRVREEGPTKIVSVFERKQATSLPALLPPSTPQFLEQQQQPPIKQHIEFGIVIRKMGVSVVDSRQEILFLTVMDLQVGVQAGPRERTVLMTIKDIQMDNQIYGRPYAVAVCPSPKSRPPVFTFESKRENFEGEDVLSLELLEVNMEALEFHLDSLFVIKLIKIFQFVTRFYERQKGISSSSLSSALSSCPASQQVPFPVLPHEVNLGEGERELFIRDFSVSPISLCITFSIIQGEDELYDETLDEEDEEEEGGLSMLTRYASDASLELHQLKVPDFFVSQGDFVKRIQSHYQQSISQQLFRLMGASDALGSPLNFISGVSSGFYDFFHQPLKEIVNDGSVGEGFVRGSRSLVSGAIGGTLGTTAKISGSLSRGLSAASTDSNFSQSQEKLTRTKATSFSSGVNAGFSSLTSGLFRGVTGLVVDPARGLKEGVGGMAKGMVSGVTGLVTKPTAGVLGMLSKTAEGIVSSEGRTRQRYPRFIGRDMVLRKYDEQSAKGQYYLFTKMETRSKEFYEDYVIASRTKSVMISSQRVFLIIIDTFSIHSEVEIAKIISIEATSVMNSHKITIQILLSTCERMCVECERGIALEAVGRIRGAVEGVLAKPLKQKDIKAVSHLQQKPQPAINFTPQSPPVLRTNPPKQGAQTSVSNQEMSQPPTPQRKITPPQQPQQSQKQPKKQYYRICSSLCQNLVLDTWKGTTNEGARVVVNEYDHQSESQKWRVLQNGGISLIVNVANSLCLTVEGGPANKKAPLRLFKFANGNTSQHFILKTSEWTTISQGKFAIDVAGASTTGNSAVNIYPYHGKQNQIWRFQKI